MGRRRLRTGDVVRAALDNARPCLAVSPGVDSQETFSRGVFLAQRSVLAHRDGHRRCIDVDKKDTYLLVLDSPTNRLGWVFAGLVRRLW